MSVLIAARRAPAALVALWLLGGAGAPSAAAALVEMRDRDAHVTLVYVRSPDCAECAAWESEDYPRLRASPVNDRINFRVVECPTGAAPPYDRFWPEDLQWVRQEINADCAAPRFVIVDRGDVAGRWLGLTSWRYSARPLLHNLVGIY